MYALGVGSMLRVTDQGVCYETMFHRNVRSYTHKITPTLLLYHELNKDNNNAEVGRRKPMRPQPCTENYKQLRMLRAGESFL